MSILTRSFAATALALSATTAHAQSKMPDFTGEWSLNGTKSDLGGMPAPQGATASITHTSAAFKFTQSMGGQSATQEIPLTTKDSTWTAPDGQPVTTSSTWAGDTLVVRSKLQRQGADISLVNRWSLSADRETMTMVQQAATPMGAMNVTLVFDRKH